MSTQLELPLSSYNNWNLREINLLELLQTHLILHIKLTQIIPRIANASKLVSLNHTWAMLSTRGSALDARVFLFKRCDFCVDCKTNNALGGFVCCDTTRKLESCWFALRLERHVSALLIDDKLILSEGVVTVARNKFIGTWLMSSYRSRTALCVDLVIVDKINSGGWREFRHWSHDFNFQFQLAKHVQSHEIALNLHLITGRGESNVRRVVKNSTCNRID